MVEANTQKTDRIFKNLHLMQMVAYRLPLAGKVSILHRVSGALLFLLLPYALYLFGQSLASGLSFATLKGFFAHFWVKAMVLVLAWAFLFHFFAGIRHLMMDFHIASTKKGGARTAASVLVLSSVLTGAVALKLWGGF